MTANNDSTNIKVFTHPKIRNLFIKMWKNYYGNDIKEVLSALMIDANVDEFNNKNIHSFLKNLSLSDSLIILKDLLENDAVQIDRSSSWNNFGDFIRDWYPTLIKYLKDIGIEYEKESATFYVHKEKMNLNSSIKYIEASHEQNIVEDEHVIIEKSKIGGKNLNHNDIVNSDLNETNMKKNEVFIVHGHDNEMKESVARFVEGLGLQSIILHEQTNKGRTIIEKFQDHSKNVACAIVLLSPDDKGCKANQFPDSAQYRARQNVILELGYFIGMFGREKVFVLAKNHKTLDIPTDILGVLYIPYENDWKVKLSREIQDCGLSVKMDNIK